MSILNTFPQNYAVLQGPLGQDRWEMCFRRRIIQTKAGVPFTQVQYLRNGPADIVDKLWIGDDFFFAVIQDTADTKWFPTISDAGNVAIDPEDGWFVIARDVGNKAEKYTLDDVHFEYVSQGQISWTIAEAVTSNSLVISAKLVKVIETPFSRYFF